MEFFLIIIVIQAIISGLLASYVAQEKNRSSGGWFFSGLFFGILGLIAIAGLPSKISELKKREPFLKKCPSCAEQIRKEALVCKYCSNKFTNDQIIADMTNTLKTKSYDNRFDALEVLWTIGNRSIIPYLIPAFDESGSKIKQPFDIEHRTFLHLSELIEKFSDNSVSVELLEILKKDGNQIKKKKIIQMLGKFRDSKAIVVLIEYLRDKKLNIFAAKSLEYYQEEVVPYLDEFVKQASRTEKKYAKQIIEKINPTVPR